MSKVIEQIRVTAIVTDIQTYPSTGGCDAAKDLTCKYDVTFLVTEDHGLFGDFIVTRTVPIPKVLRRAYIPSKSVTLDLQGVVVADKRVMVHGIETTNIKSVDDVTIVGLTESAEGSQNER